MKELSRFSDVMRRRWLVALLVFVVGVVGIVFVAPLIPAYKGTAEVLIVSDVSKDTTLADPDLPSIITSTEVLSRVIDRLRLQTDPIELAKKVKTKLPAKSSILELTYKDTDGNRAVAVTNAIADESVSFFHRVATRGYTQVLSALDERLAESRAKIAAADKRLQSASANSGFVSSDKALDDLTSQINDLQAQRGETSSSLAADQATASALEKQGRDIQPIVRSEILEHDSAVQQVQTGVGRDIADLVSQRASFKDNFPGLGALADRVSREKDQMSQVETDTVNSGVGNSPTYTQTVLDSEHANGLVSADQERLRVMDQQLAAQQGRLRDAADTGAVVGTLRAERDADVQQFAALTQRLSTAQGDAAQAASLGTLVVVSRAVRGPSTLWLYVAALVAAAFGLAIAVAYAYNALDQRFWGAREIEHVYRRPVLLQVGGRT